MSKPTLNRGQRVVADSRLYQNKYPGALSAPAGTIGTVIDFEGIYYHGTLVGMAATVEFELETGCFTVRVNERALRRIQ